MKANTWHIMGAQQMVVTFSISLPTPFQNCICLFLNLNNPILLYFQFPFQLSVSLVSCFFTVPASRSPPPNLTYLLLLIRGDQITKSAERIWLLTTWVKLTNEVGTSVRSSREYIDHVTGHDSDSFPGRSWTNWHNISELHLFISKMNIVIISI